MNKRLLVAVSRLLTTYLMIPTTTGFVGQLAATTSRRSGTVSRMSSSLGATHQPVKVLALHGSEGNGLHFSTSLYPLRDLLLSQNSNDDTTILDLQLTAPSAPFPKGGGYAWWTMPPGVRSFTAEEYIGFDESADLVVSQLTASSCDLVVAHSQGAILMAALLAQQRMDASSSQPKYGYILNGVAWPNPYGQELYDLKLDTTSTDDDDDAAAPRILFVMGQQDTINPLSSALKVKDRLEAAGYDVSVHTHAAGHSVPDDDESLQVMTDWIRAANV